MVTPGILGAAPDVPRDQCHLGTAQLARQLLDLFVVDRDDRRLIGPVRHRRFVLEQLEAALLPTGEVGDPAVQDLDFGPGATSPSPGRGNVVEHRPTEDRHGSALLDVASEPGGLILRRGQPANPGRPGKRVEPGERPTCRLRSRSRDRGPSVVFAVAWRDYSMMSRRLGPKMVRWSSTAPGSPDHRMRRAAGGCAGPAGTGRPRRVRSTARAAAGRPRGRH